MGVYLTLDHKSVGIGKINDKLYTTQLLHAFEHICGGQITELPGIHLAGGPTCKIGFLLLIYSK